MIPQRPSRTLMIWAVLACDLAIMVSKFVVGYAAGSSSLLSEAAHTTVDVSIGLLLLHGERRAGLPPDEGHPFGHGREIYFWSFVVSLLMFSGGAVVAVYTGVLAILHPEPLGDLRAAYLVLAISGLFEAGSLWIAWRRFDPERQGKSLLATVVASKDAPTFVVLLQSAAGVIGVGLAFLGAFATSRGGFAQADGLASCAIGALLAATAYVLAIESKNLLLGEPARQEIADCILELAESHQEVEGVDDIHTVQLAPDQIVVTLEIGFSDHLRTPQIEGAVADIERRVRAAVPEVREVFIHPAPAK